MAKLIYIEASPRKKRSASISIAKKFLDGYRASHPNDQIEIIDLWKKELPHFDGAIIDAKYAILHGERHTPEEAESWKKVEALIEEFKSGDKYVFSLPMWNFGIPYILKHYIDNLVQPGYTFKVTPEGYVGLVQDKKALLICARGGEYGPGSGAEGIDMQKNYMETILGFIGFKNIQSIMIEPTLSAEKKQASIQKAEERATQLAREF